MLYAVVLSLTRTRHRSVSTFALLTAKDNIDEIVHIIRSSQDAEAKKRMNERFGLR